MKLTAANHALPPGKADAIIFDDELTGFGLRVRRGTGGVVRRQWIVQYRRHGRTRRVLVGDAGKVTAAQARQHARKLLAEVELGGDPQADKKDRRDRDTLTLRSVAKEYVDARDGSIKLRSHELLTWYLLEGPHLKPLLSMPVDQVTRADIAARLVKCAKDSGTPSAIALRSATSSFFKWSMQMGYVDANPVIDAFKPKAPPSRDRVLSNAELAAIWRGLEADAYGQVIKLLMLTGARRSEVGGIRRSELFFWDGGPADTWSLPAARTKNGRALVLPITPLMRSIIETVPVREGFDVLFGYRQGGFTGWSIGKRELDAKLGLPPWRHHDIRRSVSTGMGDLGVQPHVIEQILNHQSGHKSGVAGIYNRSGYEREVRAAMLLWSDHIEALVEGRERKVTALAERRAS
jgi:integrase